MHHVGSVQELMNLSPCIIKLIIPVDDVGREFVDEKVKPVDRVQCNGSS